jgi:predicted ABC-type ATPase
MSDVFIIAGPNGAGKTTFANTIFQETFGIRDFINADEISRGLSPFNPQSVSLESGRLMLQRIKQLKERGTDFAFETTLSTKSYLPLVGEMRASGYSVTLIFIWLINADFAKSRVRKRYAGGGHFVADDIVERRYKRGMEMLPRFVAAVNHWFLYDNSEGGFAPVADGGMQKPDNIIKFDIYQQIFRQ